MKPTDDELAALAADHDLPVSDPPTEHDAWRKSRANWAARIVTQRRLHADAVAVLTSTPLVADDGSLGVRHAARDVLHEAEIVEDAARQEIQRLTQLLDEPEQVSPDHWEPASTGKSKMGAFMSRKDEG